MYHNHDFEFTEQVEGQQALYAMDDNVNAFHLQMELDSCWAHAAGSPPTEVIAKYAGRLPLVHWKDMCRSEGQVLTVEFGQGEVDLGAVAKASDQAGRVACCGIGCMSESSTAKHREQYELD